MLNKTFLLILAVVFLVLSFTTPVFAEEEGFCLTWEIYKKKMIEKYGDSWLLYHSCDNGDCDDPYYRDQNIPGPSDPIKTIRLYFHILCESDGSDCATTESILFDMVTHLNQEYLTLRIQFIYDYQFVNNSNYRHYPDGTQMKQALAVAPDSQCNVYITDYGSSSYGYFPWNEVDPLSYHGGILLSENHVYPYPNTGNVLAHELGHNLGLWHTHHGVSEVTQCGECYEHADGRDADITGDLCSDTAPTPRNYDCSDPWGIDSCSGERWGHTDPQNYMSYSGSFCWTELTSQQAGRMHCWIEQELSSWLYSEPAPADVEVTFTPRNAPITVPRTGSFRYDIEVKNNTDTTAYVDCWTMLTLPNQNPYGPVNLYYDVEFGPNSTTQYNNVGQWIPGYAMLGYYLFWGFVGDYPSNPIDSSYFNFTVITGINSTSRDDDNGWDSTGSYGFEGDKPAALPSKYVLNGNYPNPFNASTIIRFSLPEESKVSLEIYNIAGQRMELLAYNAFPAGDHEITWDASKYSSGIYLYKLTAGDNVFTKRMMLLK
ncbi:MAG: T9SS type A sorting domain-containing protein [candidate division Zixibacteria bacterium]|nr:T9SS type A sorting domain-containing protein [candidate division Zixibacteria bacterium]